MVLSGALVYLHGISLYPASVEAILDAALSFGGTITGEHGVGLLKRGGLERELSPSVLEMHRAIKRALDPAGILNRGKIFD